MARREDEHAGLDDRVVGGDEREGVLLEVYHAAPVCSVFLSPLLLLEGFWVNLRSSRCGSGLFTRSALVRKLILNVVCQFGIGLKLCSFRRRRLFSRLEFGLLHGRRFRAVNSVCVPLARTLIARVRRRDLLQHRNEDPTRILQMGIDANTTKSSVGRT